MNSIYVLGHLGLGDHILCNGLIRSLAERYDLIQIPCYLHNYEAVSFMYSDNPKIQPVAIKDEADAIAVSKENKAYSLNLGYYNPYGFNADIFDQEFYRQAGVPFQDRWDKFNLPEVKRIGLDEPRTFIHEDPKRGFVMSPMLEDASSPHYYPCPDKPFFDNVQILIEADAIHCINSSFLILADSLPDNPDQKLYLHHYARPTKYPVLRRKWLVLPWDKAKVAYIA